MSNKIKWFTIDNVVDLIRSKIKKLEAEKLNNYQIESYYIDVESKLSVLKELLREIEGL